MPLREAVAHLFRGSGLTYAVDTGVPDVPVTVSFHDLPLARALSLLVEAASAHAPRLTFQVGGGVYLVTDNPVRELEEGVEEPIWFRMHLSHLDARELAAFFDWPAFPGPFHPPFLVPDYSSGGGARPLADAPGQPHRGAAKMRSEQPRVTDGANLAGSQPAGPAYKAVAPSGLLPPGLIVIAMLADNGIVARGVPEDLLELKAVLALMDAPRPQFRIRLLAGTLSAEGLTLADTPVPLSDATHRERMRIVVTPRPTGDGAVELSLTGSVVARGTTHPAEMHIRLKPDCPAQILSFGSGARRVRVWARIERVEDDGDQQSTRRQ